MAGAAVGEDAAGKTAGLAGTPVTFLPLADVAPSRLPRYLVHVHGGAWRDPRLTAASIEPAVAYAFSGEGPAPVAAIASLNYTVSPFGYPAPPFMANPPVPYDAIRDNHTDLARESVHPQHVGDALHGLALLGSLGLTNGSYVLSGHSAGACLALQSVLQPPGHYGLGYLPEPPCPAALLGLNGLYDLPALATAEGLGASHARLRDDYERLLSGAFGTDQDAWLAPALVDHLHMTDWLRALLEQEYCVPVSALTAISEDADRAVYHVETGPGHSLVARVFSGSRPFDRIQGDAAILRCAADAGVPAEEHVAASGGRLAVHLDGRAVMVTRHIAGSRLADADAESLRQLGEIAGRLSVLQPPPDDGWLNRRAGALPREDLAYGRAMLDTVPATLPAEQRAAVVGIRRALEATSDCENLPKALIHPDCQPGNGLRDGAGRVRLIDWDGAGSGPRIVPLGVLLYHCAETSRVEAVVEGFLRYGMVTAAELDHLGDAVRFRPLVIAAREVAQSIREHHTLPDADWWNRWPEADSIAQHARQLLQ